MADDNVSPLVKKNTSGRRERRFVSYLPLVVLWFLGGSLLVFIVAPLINLVGRQTVQSLGSIASQVTVRDAIFLSLQTAAITTVVAVIFGTPLALFLARTTSRFKGVIEALVYLPLAVPHTVAGIALLLIFGKEGLFGKAAAPLGLQFYGTQAGIVIAMLFVSVPFMVTSARLGFESIDPQLEKAARTLGESPFGVFRRVNLPLGLGGIFTGAILTFARSIAEIGAVIVLAYYPLTAPVEIYNLFLSFGLGKASAMAVLFLLVALSIFLVVRYLINTFLVSGRS
jgi:molybdate/tungstate transport system permease protein